MARMHPFYCHLYEFKMGKLWFRVIDSDEMFKTYMKLEVNYYVI